MGYRVGLFFIGSSRCGLSVQPDNPFATFFSIEMGYFSMGFLCNLRWRYHRRYPHKVGYHKNSKSTSGFVQKRTRLVLCNDNINCKESGI